MIRYVGAFGKIANFASGDIVRIAHHTPDTYYKILEAPISANPDLIGIRLHDSHAHMSLDHSHDVMLEDPRGDRVLAHVQYLTKVSKLEAMLKWRGR